MRPFRITLLLTLALTALALAETPRIAVVTGVVRGLEIQPSGQGAWKRGEVWMQLGAGDVLKTAAGQMASVMFADGTQMKLDEKTEVVVRPNALDARRGRIWLLVQGNRRPYQVTTPNAVAGIEGTELEIDVGEGGKTTVSVIKGTVAVSNSAGQMRVGANQECDVVGRAAPARRAVKMMIVHGWANGVREYADVKAQVERRLVDLLTEADRDAAGLPDLSKDEKVAAVQTLLKRLDEQVAAFADIEPPPIYASAHAHRMLALDTLSLALRELERALVSGQQPTRVRALIARAQQENRLAEKQYERFGQAYEKVRASLTRSD